MSRNGQFPILLRYWTEIQTPRRKKKRRREEVVGKEFAKMEGFGFN
jgi:hypothetical protein